MRRRQLGEAVSRVAMWQSSTTWGVRQVVKGVALVIWEVSFIAQGVQGTVLGPSESVAEVVSTTTWQSTTAAGEVQRLGGRL